MYRTIHHQVPVWHNGEFIEVDHGLAELLIELWSLGVDTLFSCQGFPEGSPECECQPGKCPGCSLAYIYFTSPASARWFYDLLGLFDPVYNTEPLLETDWDMGAIVRFNPEALPHLPEIVRTAA